MYSTVKMQCGCESTCYVMVDSPGVESRTIQVGYSYCQEHTPDYQYSWYCDICKCYRDTPVHEYEYGVE